MSGVVLQAKVSPRDPTLSSFPIVVNGTTTQRVVSIPQEFQGLAASVQVINNDGTNAATVRVNGITTPLVNVPAGGSVGFTEQWIEQIEVNPNAGTGNFTILIQVVRLERLGL